jgi:signal transduction histidine kinase
MRYFKNIVIFLILITSMDAWSVCRTSALLLPKEQTPFSEKHLQFHDFEGGISFGVHNDSAAWLKFECSSNFHDHVVGIGYGHLDYVTVYSDRGDLLVSNLGDHGGLGNRYLQVQTPNFLIDQRFSNVFYLKAVNEGSLNLPIRILQKDLFQREYFKKDLFFGAFFGLLSGLALYNLFLFATLQRKVYAYYVLYVVSTILIQANLNGFLGYYVWPTAGEWMNKSVIFCFILFWLSTSLFTIDYLKLKQHSSTLYQLFFYMIVTCFVLAVVAIFVDYSSVIKTVQHLIIIISLLKITSGVMVWKKKYEPAKYFTISWSFFMVANIITTLRDMGYISPTFMVNHMSMAGSVTEVILLSLGLGSYIRGVENEKLTYEKKAGNLTIVSQSMQNLAHDIKNQLAVFELISTAKTWEEYLGWRPDMTRAISRIHAIIAEFKKDVEEIALRIRADSLDINGIATEANKTMGSDSVEIVAESETDSYQMMIDKIALERSVFNLITNAIEAGAHLVTIQSKAVSNNLVVSVIDNGPGVPDGMLAKLFQRGQSFGKPGGQGIGLFNVKSIVAGHGGTIEYRRENGLTIFEMVLPGVILLEPKAVQSNKVANPDSKEQPAQLSVLISIGSFERQEQIWAALANYPFKIYLKETQENIPSFVFTDNHEIMEKYMSIGVPIMMENGKDAPEKIARQIARRVRSQQLPRKFEGSVPLRGGVECEDC